MTLSDRILSALGRGPKRLSQLCDGQRASSVSIALNRLLKSGMVAHDGKTPRTWRLPGADA